jgi:competence protein ComEC
MTTLHYLNVGDGDCTIIQHQPSGRVTMVDICGGNLPREGMRSGYGGLLSQLAQGGRSGSLSLSEAFSAFGVPPAPPQLGDLLAPRAFEPFGNLGGSPYGWSALTAAAAAEQPGGNFAMRDERKNPLDYLKRLGITQIHRFISTHPDMDHLDGLDALFNSVPVLNFWHTGVRRTDPDFAFKRYKREDWARYRALCNNSVPGTRVLQVRSLQRFWWANKNEDGADGGDGLYILTPTDALVRAAEQDDDINEASIILALQTPAGIAVLPGDAHDAAWTHVLSIAGHILPRCALLLAPHHGRDSDRDYAFLEVIKPHLTLMGCAPAEHMAYDSWRSRELSFITNNQAGDICVELGYAPHGAVAWVENESFARAKGYERGLRNAHGQFFAGMYPSPSASAR